MLNYRIDPDFYGNARKFIIGAEGFQNGTVYPDTKAIPTMGYGYALAYWNDRTKLYRINTDAETDLSKIGITLTKAQTDMLDQIVERLNTKTLSEPRPSSPLWTQVCATSRRPRRKHCTKSHSTGR